MEPLDENDLDLKDKFLGASSTPEKKQEAVVPESGVETVEAPVVPETQVERKEGDAEKEAAYSKILSKAAPPTTTALSDDVSSDAKAVSEGQDAENKINNLVNLAQMKGVTHAVKVARHLEDNYVLDEFHDRLLADDLHAALLQKGLIKEF